MNLLDKLIHLPFVIYYCKSYFVCILLWAALPISAAAQSAAEAPETATDSLQESCESIGYTYVFQEENQHFQAVKMKDPIFIQLYDASKKKLWAPPLRNTQIKTSSFGPRQGHFHHGIDLALRMGEPVFAVFDGIIKLSTYGGGYGNYVIIKHDNGLETLYAHLSIRKVKLGQRIKAGQLLGLGGSTGYSTGPHLHFEVRYQGYTLNPMLVYDFKQANQIRSDVFVIKPHHFRHYGNASPKKGYLFHEVGSSENLSSIAQKYETSPQTIIQMNKLQETNISQGQMLRIR